MKIRYFDHAATTPVSDTVLKEMLPFFNVEYGKFVEGGKDIVATYK